MLKIAYFGTPPFAADILEGVINSNLDLQVSFVVTQEDKPVGRKQVLTSSPVKLLAKNNNIPVHETLQGMHSTLQDIDLAIVFAYGKLISDDLLSIPRFGFWNIHPSLLPKYRGATPMTFPLLLGDSTTGVSLMQMDSLMDHGPIVARQSYELTEHTTRLDLEKELTKLGQDLLMDSLKDLIEERLDVSTFVVQDHSKKTLSLLLKKEDGYVEWDFLKDALGGILENTHELPGIYKRYQDKNPHEILPSFTPARVVWNMYRALHPWPGVWTVKDGKRMKLLDLALAGEKIVLNTIQMEGKTRATYLPNTL